MGVFSSPKNWAWAATNPKTQIPNPKPQNTNRETQRRGRCPEAIDSTVTPLPLVARDLGIWALGFGIWDLRKLNLRVPSNHGGPLAHTPARHETILHVGIGGRELLGGGRRIAAEQEHGPIGRIRERPGKDQLVTRLGRSGQRNMRRAKWRSPLDIVFNNVIEQQVMHRE